MVNTIHNVMAFISRGCMSIDAGQADSTTPKEPPNVANVCCTVLLCKCELNILF